MTDCLLCNRMGVVPVLSWVDRGGSGETLLCPVETVYVCKCGYAKDRYITKTHNKQDVRIVVSQRFFDVFDQTQFPYNTAISDAFAGYGRVDYITIYLAGFWASVNHTRKTGNPAIVMPSVINGVDISGLYNHDKWHDSTIGAKKRESRLPYKDSPEIEDTRLGTPMYA